jgi:rhodanese-related sulfurtransferase
MEIKTISRDELKEKLDRGDKFRLIMTLHGWAFRAQHIPGSEHFDTPEETLYSVRPDEEIVVYCSDPACIASQFAYKALVDNGYTNVRRYEGGLSDWVAAGLPLEGDGVP